MQEIDKKLIDWFKEFFRSSSLIDVLENDGELCNPKKEDKSCPTYLSIRLKYNGGHRESWLLNLDGKKGNDRMATPEDRKDIDAFKCVRVELFIRPPKETQNDIVWHFYCLESVDPLAGEGYTFGILYDKEKQFFKFSDKWIVPT